MLFLNENTEQSPPPIILIVIVAFFIFWVINASKMRLRYPIRKKYKIDLEQLKISYNTGLQEYLKPVLNKYFPFYRDLSREEKIRFEKRTAAFLDCKTFLDENRNPLDDNLALMISASSIQLTFGLKDFLLLHFRRIKVFPASYNLPLIPTRFKGHTSEDGSVFLSWEAFAEGFKDPDDGVNLGLHEWGHALEANNHFSSIDKKFLYDFKQWEPFARSELERMRSGQNKFLRSYGSTNEHELFAVCIEFFFERPAELSRELLSVFEQMKFLLNQDPTIRQSPVISLLFKDEEIFIPKTFWQKMMN